MCIHTKEGADMNEIITLEANTSIQNTGISESMFYKWLSFIDASEKTQATYTRAIKQFYLYLQAEGISNPTREDVLTYKEKLSADHKPATINLYLQAIKLFFRWTAEQGLYPNIAEHIKGAKLAKGFKKDNLTSTQAKSVLSGIDTNTLHGARDYAIIALMMTTGLRTIEVERANIGDMRTMGDSTVLYVQGKGHTDKDAYVKIPRTVEAAIWEYLTFRGKAEDTEPLFASISHRNGGGRMTTRSISRLVKEAMIDAGYNSDRLTAHSLRHTAATLNLLNGGTPEETMQLLRHANLNTTLIYSHALERANNNSEYRIADAIFA